MAGISSKQAEFIADLVEQTGTPFLILDAEGNKKVTSREASVQWITKNKDQVWAQNAVTKLKEEISANGNRSETVEMATEKQIAYGRNLDVQRNGKQTHDWNSATKTQAWQWIKDLKESADATRR